MKNFEPEITRKFIKQNAKQSDVEFVDLLGLKRVTGADRVIRVIRVIHMCFSFHRLSCGEACDCACDFRGPPIRGGPKSHASHPHRICHTLMVTSSPILKNFGSSLLRSLHTGEKSFISSSVLTISLSTAVFTRSSSGLSLRSSSKQRIKTL